MARAYEGGHDFGDHVSSRRFVSTVPDWATGQGELDCRETAATGCESSECKAKLKVVLVYVYSADTMLLHLATCFCDQIMTRFPTCTPAVVAVLLALLLLCLLPGCSPAARELRLTTP